MAGNGNRRCQLPVPDEQESPSVMVKEQHNASIESEVKSFSFSSRFREMCFKSTSFKLLTEVIHMPRGLE